MENEKECISDVLIIIKLSEIDILMFLALMHPQRTPGPANMNKANLICEF